MRYLPLNVPNTTVYTINVEKEDNKGPTHVAAPHITRALAYSTSLFIQVRSDKNPNKTLPNVFVIPTEDTKNEALMSLIPENCKIKTIIMYNTITES